jgi:hypothetical protein
VAVIEIGFQATKNFDTNVANLVLDFRHEIIELIEPYIYLRRKARDGTVSGLGTFLLILVYLPRPAAEHRNSTVSV